MKTVRLIIDICAIDSFDGTQLKFHRNVVIRRCGAVFVR
jgi:hypothetical protein